MPAEEHIMLEGRSRNNGGYSVEATLRKPPHLDLRCAKSAGFDIGV